MFKQSLLLVAVLLTLTACSPASTTPDVMEKKAPSPALKSPTPQAPVEIKTEESAEMKKEMIEQNDDVFSGNPGLTLEDVAESGATGTAWLMYVDGKTHHRVTSPNLPELTNDDFYEGWVVRTSPLDILSTGKMEFDDTQGKWVLNYLNDKDLTDHKLVVITLEPNDGDPAPAKHIIEASF